MKVDIRDERAGDEAAIRRVTALAFAGAPHSDGTEAEIVERLREGHALAVSLVADDEGAIVGHVAFSPVTIEESGGWFGLGPVAVAPVRQHHGIGHALITEGLARLRAQGAKGCVVLGDPAYYARFGFAPDPALTYPGPPPQYFQALRFDATPATGIVRYHPAFG